MQPIVRQAFKRTFDIVDELSTRPRNHLRVRVRVTLHQSAQHFDARNDSDFVRNALAWLTA